MTAYLVPCKLLTALGALLLSLTCTLAPFRTLAQSVPSPSPQPATSQELVWIDTDIGDDIDDAFAIGLILRSPELKVEGISTAFGDTEARARIVDRLLHATGATDIPVTAGVATKTDNVMTQAAYGRSQPGRSQFGRPQSGPDGSQPHEDGVAAMLQLFNQHPGRITLIAIGPLFNIGAAIDRDPAAFKKVKRVVMMGGSIARGYDRSKGEVSPADAEWNINRDPTDAAKLFRSGVPIFMLPLDSTQIHLPQLTRDEIFGQGVPVTDQLTLLYHQWSFNTGNHAATPTLYDPVAAAYTFEPALCPMEPMRIEVDSKGFTRKVDGQPNAQVCLKSDEAAFLKLLTTRLKQKTP